MQIRLLYILLRKGHVAHNFKVIVKDIIFHHNSIEPADLLRQDLARAVVKL
jgi:hypothetical protein